MSTGRRDTAAARAALARRRQRGIFTPSPTNTDNNNNAPFSQEASQQTASNGSKSSSGSSGSSISTRSKAETKSIPPQSNTPIANSQSSGLVANKKSTTSSVPKARDRPPQQAGVPAQPLSATTSRSEPSPSQKHTRSQQSKHVSGKAPPASAALLEQKTSSNGNGRHCISSSPFVVAAAQSADTDSDRAVRFTAKLHNGDGGGASQQQHEGSDVCSIGAASSAVVLVEEPQPTAGKKEILDAKCLTYCSPIVIRSSLPVHQSKSHYVSIQKKTRGDAARYLATMNGKQVFSLAKWCPQQQDNDASTSTKQNKNDGGKNCFVRYGDVVVLRSSIAQDRTLGVRGAPSLSVTHGGGASFEVGFFRSVPTLADQWTVLRGGGNRVVLVGSASLEVAATINKATINKATTNGEKTAAIRSGDAVLLRNNSTGGLLAIDSMDHETLHLVTDSYDTNVIRTGVPSDKDPLSKIQHHDRILPTSMETFQFVNAEVPPCPQWVDDGNRRSYDSESFLYDSTRNDRQDETTLALFGPTVRDGRKSFQAPLKRGIKTQERLLLDEVIGSFFGLEGNYIQYRDNGDEFCFTMSEPAGVAFDTSLRNLVNRILPLSTSFVNVRSFLSLHRPGYEYGFVVQAVCEAFDELLHEYFAFAAEMEKHLRLDSHADPLTMSKLNVSIQTPLHRMIALEHVVAVIRDRKGGSLLNALRELKTRVFAGDGVARQVLDILLQQGSVPYFKMLDAWLESGVIHDPFDEFMIETSEHSESVMGYDGDSWDEMFRIRSEHALLTVLASPKVQEQILLTGKYWNAVQLCQRTDTAQSPNKSSHETCPDGHVHFGMDSVALSKFVHSTYRIASQKLLNLLMGDFDAMETLLTIKRFFLLHQGDFLVHLFDAAEDELSRELKDVSRGRMQQLVSMCVQLTEPETDDWMSALPAAEGASPHGPLTAQRLRCSFAPDSLIDHLDALHSGSGGIDANEPRTPSRHPYGTATKEITGIEAFSIHFDRIPFPTSLLVSQRALSNYQLLFRHLLFAKHVERRLVGIWLDHQMMKQFQSLRRVMGPTYCLRQRMLHFMQNFIYYMMFEVIEPNWLEMENALRKQESTTNRSSQGIQTVDDVIRVHNEFLNLALVECLLTNRELIRTLAKLMRTCLLFSEQLKRFMQATRIADENKAVAKEKRGIIQRNLNDPTNMKRAPSKKAIRKAMVTQNEERSLRMQKQAARVERELTNESYKRMISRFDEVFTENLATFMKQLLSASTEEHHSQKANLCIRLDYNGFVTKEMGLH